MLTTLALPYVQANGDGGLRARTQLIVIHATDNTATAEEEAAYCARRTDQTSCHVFVDADSAIQVNQLDHIAYGCYPTGNARSIQFELCGVSDQLAPAVIARAVGLVATVARSWGIPAVRPSLDQMRAGLAGIVGHVDVTNAWHEGDHTDPGPSFPWPDFLAQVDASMKGNTVTQLEHNWLYNLGSITRALAEGADECDQVTPETSEHYMLSLAPYWAKVRAAAVATPSPEDIAKAVNDDAAARLAH